MCCRVLVVDDDPHFRQLARDVLEHRGCVVVGEADTGAAARSAAERLAPDAVLLDVRLPDESGFEVCAALSESGRGPGRPARLRQRLRRLRGRRAVRREGLRPEVRPRRHRPRQVLAGGRCPPPRGGAVDVTMTPAGVELAERGHGEVRRAPRPRRVRGLADAAQGVDRDALGGRLGAAALRRRGAPCDSRAVRARFSWRLRGWPGALQAVYSGPLRRAQISFAAMWAGESAFMVALAVVAFRDGGVAAVGAVTAARMATAALLAPFLATMADRVRRERVLTCVGVVRAAMLGCAAAVTATGGPPAATYGFAVVATVAVALYRPGALGPAARAGQVAEGPDERERGARHAGLARHARRPGGRGRAARGERTGRGLRRVRRGVAVRRSGRRRAPVRRAAASGRRPRARPRHAPGLHHHRARSHAVADHGARGRADVHARLPDRVRRRRRDRPARHRRRRASGS